MRRGARWDDSLQEQTPRALLNDDYLHFGLLLMAFPATSLILLRRSGQVARLYESTQRHAHHLSRFPSHDGSAHCTEKSINRYRMTGSTLAKSPRIRKSAASSLFVKLTKRGYPHSPV